MVCVAMNTQIQSKARWPLIVSILLLCFTTNAEIMQSGCGNLHPCSNIMAWWHYEEDAIENRPKCDIYNLRNATQRICWNLPLLWNQDIVAYSIASNSVCSFYQYSGCSGVEEIIRGKANHRSSRRYGSARCKSTTNCSQ